MNKISAKKLKKRTFTDIDAETARNLKVIWEDKKKERGPNGKRKYTQEICAEAIGISQGTFNQYLNGKLAFGRDAVMRFAKLFNVSPDELRPNFYTPEIKEDPGRYNLNTFILKTAVKSVRELNEENNLNLSEDQILDYATLVYKILDDYEEPVTSNLIRLIATLKLTS